MIPLCRALVLPNLSFWLGGVSPSPPPDSPFHIKTGLLLSHSSEFIDKLQAYFEEGHTEKRARSALRFTRFAIAHPLFEG